MLQKTLMELRVFFCGLSSGDLDVFRHSDVLFWVTFCSIMVVVPFFFLRWPREVNWRRPLVCVTLLPPCGRLENNEVAASIHSLLFKSWYPATKHIFFNYCRQSIANDLTCLLKIAFQLVFPSFLCPKHECVQKDIYKYCLFFRGLSY